MAKEINQTIVTSWVDVAANSDFSIQNMPFGIFRTANRTPRVCSAIGENVVDIVALSELGYFEQLDVDTAILERPFLNDFIALGKSKTRAIRQRLIELLSDEFPNQKIREQASAFLLPMREVELLLPLDIGDYTDFYSSREHATNVGALFRDPENALLPNWLHLPVGYHGRASSIVVSDTPIRRPRGQFLPKGQQQPQFGATQMLDFELEMAFVIGQSNPLGTSVPVYQAEDSIFGMLLFNDWSARDIQSWEYRPLGPFLGKSFASTISPWVVTLEALEPFRAAAPVQDPAVLPYLQEANRSTFDIQLEVALQPKGKEATTVCQSNFKHLYWTISQQLAHHTVNGCTMRIGDLCASGTISGTVEGSYGSLLELTRRGAQPLTLPDGEQRAFLEDEDTVILRGFCQNENYRVGFGEARGQILG